MPPNTSSKPPKIVPNSDGTGFRLNGGTMISEAVSPGSVQIPAGGQPIVLMADCGTVGGYPKIATIISVDRGHLAQMRFGVHFQFEQVSVEQAEWQLLDIEREMAQFSADVKS